MNNKRTVKPKALKPSNRLFLVVADDSKELHQALYYAARRAATAGGEIALFRCIEPVEGQLWGGVSEIMEAETEQASKILLEELSNYCEKLGAPKPRTFVRKGTVYEQLFNLIDSEESIRVLVLGVSTFALICHWSSIGLDDPSSALVGESVSRLGRASLNGNEGF